MVEDKDIWSQKRLPGESYDEYRHRRKVLAEALKVHLRGEWFIKHPLKVVEGGSGSPRS